MSDGVRVAGDPAATVHAERDRSGEPRQEDTNNPGAFTPGQAVELAVQVGSWTEGMSAEVIGPCDAGSAYEWDVWVKRESGPVRVSLYEHELRSRQPSLIERLSSRTTSDEWPGGFKLWEMKATPKYPWDAVGFPQPDENGVVTFPIINNQADGEDPFGAAVDALFREAFNLLLSKHHDYGPRNISQAPGGALNGLAVRLHDKLSRLSHLLQSDGEPNHESLRDTLLDVMNYGAIGVLVCDGNWPDD